MNHIFINEPYIKHIFTMYYPYIHLYQPYVNHFRKVPYCFTTTGSWNPTSRSRLRTHGSPPTGRFSHSLSLSEDDAIVFGGRSRGYHGDIDYSDL